MRRGKGTKGLTPTLLEYIYIVFLLSYTMGKTIHMKVTEILAELKMKGELISYDDLKKLIYIKLGSDSRTIKRFDDYVKTMDLLEDKGNGVLRIR